MRIGFLLLACGLIASADDRDDKAQVVAVVNTLFEGMASKNGDTITSTMTADAKLIAAQPDRVGTPITRDDFAKRIAAGNAQVVERMWDPTVLVRGRIAMLWAEYDVHVGGKFNHCGIDAFMLLKSDDGWKISTIEYTSETQNCKPSPLGPLTAK